MEDRAAPQTIHPDAGDESNQEARNTRRNGEQDHLHGRSVQDQDRQERQRGVADERAEDRDRLARPQFHEVGVAPEAA